MTCLYQQQLLNWTVLHDKSNEKQEILGIVGLILRNMNITLRFEENREKQRPSRLLSEVNNNLDDIFYFPFCHDHGTQKLFL